MKFRFLLCLAVSTYAAMAQQLKYPKAERQNQKDIYHGIEILDPYRWMEDMDSGETKRWVDAQEGFLNRYLEDDAPQLKAIAARIEPLRSFDGFSMPKRVGQRSFFSFSPQDGSPSTLMVRENGEEKALLTPDQYRHHQDERLNGFSVSDNGRYLLIDIGRNQSTWRNVQLWDIQENQYLGQVASQVRGGIGGAIWRKDSTGFFYMKLDPPAPGKELKALIKNPRLMEYHIPSGETRLVKDNGGDENLLFSTSRSDDGRYLVVSQSTGMSQDQAVSLISLEEKGYPSRDLLPYGLGQFNFLGNSGPHFRFRTTADAPRRRIISIDIRQPGKDHWRELIPESGATIRSAVESGKFMAVTTTLDAKRQLFVHDLDGKRLYEVAVPEGQVGGMGGTPVDDNRIFVGIFGLFTPGSYFHLDMATGEIESHLKPELPLDASQYVTEQVFYTSKDGTRVPMYLAYRKDHKPHKDSKVFMYGYGAYGWTAYPWYQPNIVAWLDMGGVYALPGIRGGGEYGDQWHKAGIVERKQVGIDDFNSAAQWLIKQGYTSKGGIVANGGSASGVLAAAAVIQQPQLYGAAVIDFPYLDMVRFDQYSWGKYRAPEYGSTENPDHFKVLYGYSPYHNIKTDFCYPPTLVTAGENDTTTVPMHAYKYVAQLQHKVSCEQPMMLHVIRGSGHYSYGTNPAERTHNLALQIAFLAKVLKIEVPEAFPRTAMR